MSGSKGLSEPPEGALTGDTVPRENEEAEMKDSAVEAVLGQLKAHPRYEGYSEYELRAVARQFVEQME